MSRSAPKSLVACLKDPEMTRIFGPPALIGEKKTSQKTIVANLDLVQASMSGRLEGSVKAW